MKETKELCNSIYQIWSKHSFLGYRRITAIFNSERENDNKINKKKVLRLMRLMKLKAVYPNKNRRKNTNEQKEPIEYKFPYLLKDIEIDKPNKVWATDITYIKTPAGFVYLTALIDNFSRFVVSWQLSISMTAESCLNVLNKGIDRHKRPEIVNSGQGSQFTCIEWIKKLKEENIQISMDGKGRWVDNVLIERFWRTVKQEEIYINPPDSIEELKQRINRFVKFYNYQRPHQSLNYKTPSQIYYGDDNKRRRIRF
jgi:putative transposase